MVYLANLRIGYFRGFLDPQEITFAVPNKTNGSGLTILVGPNNVGKSTVIEALRTVIAPPQFMDRRERHVDQAVRISMVDTTPRTKSITNPGLGAVISSEGQAFPTESHFRYVPSRRPWAARAGPQPFGPVDYWRIRTAQGRDQDGQLIGRLSSFGSEEYSDGQIYLEYTTLNGSQHHADLFGDGIASLFRIALALYDPDIEVCVAIDEPELSLHPQAQKDSQTSFRARHLIAKSFSAHTRRTS